MSLTSSALRQLPRRCLQPTTFFEAIKIRRSTITLTKDSPISNDRIVDLVQQAVEHAPSPFHIQSCLAVVLFGADHDKLWDFTLTQARETLSREMLARSEPKIEEYKAAYGTVLFFEDTQVVKKFPQQLQDLIAQFPQWSKHSNGMNQSITRTALNTEGLGANLQHYQTLIRGAVIAIWNAPKTWLLRAQLVLGKATGPPRGGVDKEFALLEDRVLVYGTKV